jgi:hypothetical protein
VQKTPALNPCCPRKGPTGGCIEAKRAGIVNVTQRSKFFLVVLATLSSNRFAKLLAICSIKTLDVLALKLENIDFCWYTHKIVLFLK